MKIWDSFATTVDVWKFDSHLLSPKIQNALSYSLSPFPWECRIQVECLKSRGRNCAVGGRSLCAQIELNLDENKTVIPGDSKFWDG